ncbi:hypothetical protein NPX13_g712 [Xylaria arbuscula]|uniref:Methyltransferase n=1 Tax=Xylaria arbuscula TaxID=114810 RepID=A0A9W8NP07_9PEZI|nr:hypothetical protein NPX13_g712 [Xylaria arbuscula]
MATHDQGKMARLNLKIGYLADADIYREEKPFFSNIPFFNIPGAKQHNLRTSFYDDVPIRDVRGDESAVSMDRHGFMLAKKAVIHDETKFLDEKWIMQDYYPEITDFIKTQLGARKVVIFDHTVRRANPDMPMYQRGPLGNRQPSKMAHVDQTAEAAEKRVRYHMKDEAEQLLKRRYQIVNCWHPLFGPLRDYPLILCDYFSVEKDRDLRASDLIFPHYLGEQYLCQYNPRHEWYYVSDQQPNECWLFKCHDSVESSARFTVHNSVDLPKPENATAPLSRRSAVAVK